MKKTILTSLLIAGSLVAGSLTANKRGIAPVSDSFYMKECASCHFAYQPGLLPSRSWEKLMGNLSNHFSTDASLEPADNKIILNYLIKNSAENSTDYKRSKKINDSIPKNETPISLTETKYFIKKHKGIPVRLIEQKEVKSLANCMACHTTADTGSYSERAIKIPNYGKWED